MKLLLATLLKAIGKLWKFATNTITICLIASIVLFGLSILMPDNALKAVEIIKGLI